MKGGAFRKPTVRVDTKQHFRYQAYTLFMQDQRALVPQSYVLCHISALTVAVYSLSMQKTGKGGILYWISISFKFYYSMDKRIQNCHVWCICVPHTCLYWKYFLTLFDNLDRISPQLLVLLMRQVYLYVGLLSFG